MIDAEMFTRAVGEAPTGDDLERVNCDEIGQEGHTFCGWCTTCNNPRFYCRCRTMQEIVFTAVHEHGGPKFV